MANQRDQKIIFILKSKKLLLWIFIAGFITNLVWENAQAPLYEGYENFRQHFLFCVIASIVDGIVILIFYYIITLIRNNLFWLFNIGVNEIIILCILGMITGIAFEVMAFKSEAWSYQESMPVIFGIGLMPLLQLSILSIVTVYTVRTLIKKNIIS